MNILRSRISISSLFFMHGLCFATWGSRIPAIQEKLGLSEAALGTVLFALPVGSLTSMPLAAWLVTKLGSRNVLAAAILLYAALLVTLGLADSSLQLMALLVVFGLCSNMVNVSLNTQAVDIESLYKRPIMASLHGLWSTAGFFGALLASFMIGNQVVPFAHFGAVFVLIVLGLAFTFRGLLPDIAKSREVTQSSFALPDRSLLGLGLISFFSMICEGAMFDWSGVYFKKVLGAEGAWVSAGYVAFMTTMAGTRFVADGFKAKWGLRRVLQTSGILVFIGLLIAVLLPSLIASIFGFLLVGAGVSAVVPMVFSEAGKTKVMSPSAAIAAVSTIGFAGFLVGPPMIGWIAGLTNLRVSFAIIAIMGLSICLLAPRKPSLESAIA